MNEMLSRSIADIASALRSGEFSATELMTAALDRHGQFGERLKAYKLFDAERALESARAADQLLASNDDAPPLTGTRYPSKTSTVSTVSRRLRERLGSYLKSGRGTPGSWLDSVGPAPSRWAKPTWWRWRSEESASNRTGTPPGTHGTTRRTGYPVDRRQGQA